MPATHPSALPAAARRPRRRTARRRTGSLGLLGVLLVVLAAAGSGVAGAGSAAADSGVGWIRAAHLVPGVGAARVDLAPKGGGGSSPIVMSPNATYGAVTGYQKVKPGDYTLTVRPATGSNAPLLARQFTVPSGQAMTLAVVGTASAPRLATLHDQLTPPKNGAVNVRVFPAVSKAQQVTVAAEHGPTLADGAVIGQASPYRSVPAGTWKLRVSADGTTPSTNAVQLSAGGVYTVVVLDAVKGDALRTEVVADAAGVSTAPSGGAQTGLGGTASPSPLGTPWALGVGALGLAALTAAALRRRPAPTA